MIYNICIKVNSLYDLIDELGRIGMIYSSEDIKILDKNFKEVGNKL